MTNSSDALQPFTRTAGVLYAAPLGTDLPNNTVKDGVFAMSWPMSWLPIIPDAGATDPEECTWRLDHGVWSWRFGDWPSIWAARFGVPFGVRAMVGWEALTGDVRFFARQAYLVDGEWVLEEAAIYHDGRMTKFRYPPFEIFKAHRTGEPLRARS